MPDNVQLEVYKSIAKYALDGNLSELSQMAKIAFSFVKPQIDRDIEKYNKVVERNRNNGKSGGRKPKETERNPKNPVGYLETQKTQANPKNLEYIYDNDNVNNNKENTTNVVSKKEAAKAATLARKEDFYQSLVPFVGQYPREMIRDFFEYWSEMNKSETKMRYEQQPTWEVSKRLATWAKKENGYGKRTYDIERDSEQRKYNSVVAVSTRVQEAAARRLAELKAAGVVKDL